MTNEERRKVIAEMIANPEEFKRKTQEAAKRKNPHMTEEQLENAWKQAAEQFGL